MAEHSLLSLQFWTSSNTTRCDTYKFPVNRGCPRNQSPNLGASCEHQVVTGRLYRDRSKSESVNDCEALFVRMLGKFKDVGCDGAARLARNDEVGCCSIQPVGTDVFLSPIEEPYNSCRIMQGVRQNLAYLRTGGGN